MKSLSILGATGSIGTSALDIVRMHPDRFSVKAMTCNGNIALLAEQISEFQPQLVCVGNETAAMSLSKMISAPRKPDIVFGEQGLTAAASHGDSDMVLLAMVGAAGLKPALSAIQAKKQIALANKETLVMAGSIVMEAARENQVELLPVDSEHSAIYQCLSGNQKKNVKKIFLTASGGPFRTRPFNTFSHITLEDALNHPTWNMGHKITIDSATMMNKGLEIIEAVHLFDISHEKIEVVIHPQSIIHSMVGFTDGTVMAQMGIPDMKGAISYAFSQPDRIDLGMDFPSFPDIQALTFEAPDLKKFPSLEFAFEACRQGGTLPAVLNAANEEAVTAFLEKRINFLDIFKLISRAMQDHTCIDNPDISGIIEADSQARETVKSLI